MRQFQPAWLKQYPWLNYSSHVHGAFCKSCAIFCTREGRRIHSWPVCVQAIQLIGENVREIQISHAA